MNFDESKHPRDEMGRFTDGAGGTHIPTGAELQRLREMGVDEQKGQMQKDRAREEQQEKMTPEEKRNKTKDEFFGEEFKEVKGSQAIEKLLKEKRGHVNNAFERSEIDGGITLVWGDDTGGLGHTIMRRDKQLKDGTGKTSGIEMARKIPEIMEKGAFSIGKNGRPNIVYHDFRVIISPTFDGKKLNWIISAMEPQQENQ